MTSKLTILYISDDDALCKNDISVLQKNGYDVVRAKSSREAIALLFLNRRIDAIVLREDNSENGSGSTVRMLHSIRADIPVVCSGAELNRLRNGINAWAGSAEELIQVLGAMWNAPAPV